MEQAKKYCTIYLVRHGETENNVNDIVQGHVDSPLTDKGIQDVKRLQRELKNIKFDAVFSSDIGRAVKTAQLVMAEKQLAVNTTHLLRERFYGDYEGHPAKKYYQDNEAMFAKFETLGEAAKRKFKVYPSMESEEEAMGRFIQKLREIAVTFLGKTVLVVSHGTVMRTFLFHLGYMSRQQLTHGSLLNSGYIKLESDGVDFFVKKFVGYKKP
jgi:broad specificity phosphatase PhoE